MITALSAAILAAALIPFNPQVRTVVSSGDPCSSATSKETQAGTGADTVLGDANTYYRKLAFEWVSDSAFTACNVSLKVKKFGAPTSAIRVKIYASSGGHPQTGGVLANGTGAYISTAGVTTSYGQLSLTGLSCSIASATTYWVIFECQTVGDASNYFHIDTGLGAPGDMDWDFDDNDVWSDLDDLNGNFTINGY